MPSWNSSDSAQLNFTFSRSQSSKNFQRRLDSSCFKSTFPTTSTWRRHKKNRKQNVLMQFLWDCDKNYRHAAVHGRLYQQTFKAFFVRQQCQSDFQPSKRFTRNLLTVTLRNYQNTSARSIFFSLFHFKLSKYRKTSDSRAFFRLHATIINIFTSSKEFQITMNSINQALFSCLPLFSRHSLGIFFCDSSMIL